MASVVSPFLIAALWAAASVVAAAASRDFVIIAFGDSLSDTGIVHKVTGGLVPRSPYYWNGRFTNEKGNWQDWINGRNVDIVQSKNYAIAGAHACRRWDVPSFAFFIPTVREQAAVFLHQSFDSSSLLGNRTAVPLIWAGHNDVLKMGDPSPRELANLSQDVAICVLHTARLLLAAHVPYVLVGTLAPVELSPKGNGSEIMAAVVDDINRLIKKGVSNLQTELSMEGRNQSVLLWDIHDFMVQAVRNYMSLGFKYSSSSSCLTYKPGKDVMNGVPIAECPQPDDYMFYDSEHPTSKVHRLISEHLLQTLARGGVLPTVPTAPLHRDRMLGLLQQQL